MEDRTDGDITLDVTFDYSLLRSILKIPKVWDRMVDDFSPAVQDYQFPSAGPELTYLVARWRGAIIGFFMVVKRNPIMVEFHAVLVPLATGAIATAALKTLLGWIWKYAGAQRIVTTVPDFNKAAQKKAAKIGMTVYGINERAFIKDGQLGSQILFGINREVSPCPS